MGIFWTWLQRNCLWLVAIGVMIASSGIDGAYMEKLNEWQWFGYILNTVSDIASPAIMYWYGRLQLDKSTAKRNRSKNLLRSEWLFIGYSWLFSWRQLRPAIRIAESSTVVGSFGAPVWLETVELELLAFVFAGFAPLLLAVIGYVIALLHGRIEDAPPKSKDKPAIAETKLAFTCRYPGCRRSFGSQAALNGHQSKHKNGRKESVPAMKQEA